MLYFYIITVMTQQAIESRLKLIIVTLSFAREIEQREKGNPKRR